LVQARLNRIKFEVCLTAFFVTSLVLNFQSVIINSHDLFFSGDALQHQYWFQLISQTNLIDIDNNIASPVGDSIWSNPQLGLLISVLALVLQDIFQFNSSQSVTIVFLIIGTINFIFTLKLARIVKLNYVLTTLLSLTIGLSPFYLEKIGALGVAAFYPLIAVLVTLISSQSKVKGNLNREYFFLFMIIFTASFWWLIVMAAVIFPVLIVNFVYHLIFKGVNSIYKYWLNLFFITYGSLALYFFVSLQYSRLRGENRWQPWQSEIFSGKFSDLLLGSPLLSSLIPDLISTLAGGTSPGATGDRLGFVQTLGVFFLIFFIMFYLIAESLTKIHDFWIRHLIFFGFILVLFYISGGLGNLTSGLLILLEQTSPIRAWSRINMIISLIGLLLLTFYLQKYSSKKLQIIVTLAMVMLTYADLTNSKKPIFSKISESMEYQVSKYASEKVVSCKILQIPVDTQPIPQDYLNENRGAFYYSGYKQYILNPELSWSFGNWTQSYGWLYEAAIPTLLDREWLNARNENICGVIYDKEFAKWRELSAENWPGLKVNLGNPSFTNSRYDFYLISNDE
jgi:hypothetical protein